MAKPTPFPKRLSQKAAIRLLESHGWALDRGGKHVVKMTKASCRPITLPMHNGNDYGPDLTTRILRQAGLKRDNADVDAEQTGTEGES